MGRSKLTYSTRRKGIMGIETLIIFIAMILVAAVAAGVLLKTAGLLQQRALATGNEATERVVTGLEVASITANANVTANTFNEMETLVRLQAGSYDMSFLSAAYVINSLGFSYQADLMHTLAPNYFNRSIPFIDNNSWVSVGNIDINPEDSSTDYVRLIFNISGANDGLQFNLSHGGLFNVSLGDDVENGTLSISDVIIKPTNASKYDPHYGFYTFTGTGTGPFINATASGGFSTIANSPSNNDCTFEKLIPDYKFCFRTKVGDDDHILETGELVTLRYKLSADNTIDGDNNFDIQFIPKRGTIIEIALYVPEIFQRQVVQLWP